MTDPAPLEAVESGFAPARDGWFAVNVRDAAWLVNDAFGARCVFEADVCVETETDSPREAYAPYPHWQRGRPPGGLPWG